MPRIPSDLRRHFDLTAHPTMSRRRKRRVLMCKWLSRNDTDY